MTHGGELGGGRRPDALARRFAHGLGQFREPLFDRERAMLQQIVVGVGDFRRSMLIIQRVVMRQLGRESLELFARLGAGQAFDGLGGHLDHQTTVNPLAKTSSSSIQMVFRPVAMAEPWIDGMTAGRPPSSVSASTRPIKRLPM